jgi:hypothetical protein
VFPALTVHSLSSLSPASSVSFCFHLSPSKSIERHRRQVEELKEIRTKLATEQEVKEAIEQRAQNENLKRVQQKLLQSAAKRAEEGKPSIRDPPPTPPPQEAKATTKKRPTSAPPRRPPSAPPSSVQAPPPPLSSSGVPTKVKERPPSSSSTKKKKSFRSSYDQTQGNISNKFQLLLTTEIE